MLVFGSFPFSVGNHLGVSYTLMKFDLRNIPMEAIIESAILRINVTANSENNGVFNLNCVATQTNWNYSSAIYLQEGAHNEISYDNLVKNISLAEKAPINLRNDWVSFNITIS